MPVHAGDSHPARARRGFPRDGVADAPPEHSEADRREDGDHVFIQIDLVRQDDLRSVPVPGIERRNQGDAVTESDAGFEFAGIGRRCRLPEEGKQLVAALRAQAGFKETFEAREIGLVQQTK